MNQDNVRKHDIQVLSSLVGSKINECHERSTQRLAAEVKMPVSSYIRQQVDCMILRDSHFKHLQNLCCEALGYLICIRVGQGVRNKGILSTRFRNLEISRFLKDFQKITRFPKDFKISKRLQDFQKISRFPKDYKISKRFQDFQK